jgi:hypothetical protein
VFLQHYSSITGLRKLFISKHQNRAMEVRFGRIRGGEKGFKIIRIKRFLLSPSSTFSITVFMKISAALQLRSDV